MAFRNCLSFRECMTETNNQIIRVDNATYLGAVMPMHNLIEYSNHYSKISRRLWQYYTDESNATITDFQSF